MKLQIKKFEKFTSKHGTLIPYYRNYHFKNFKIKRFFFIYGNKKYSRGDHAHKKCNQILIPIKGKATIIITKSNNKKYSFNLSMKNNRFLIVPTKHWIKILFKEQNSILLTLCDYKYDKSEYIENINDFLK